LGEKEEEAKEKRFGELTQLSFFVMPNASQVLAQHNFFAGRNVHMPVFTAIHNF
jgi:hypothetical protein